MIRWYDLFAREGRSVTYQHVGKQYQEIFALCQALPGPASTKMIYCINIIHGGFIVGLMSFFVWR